MKSQRLPISVIVLTFNEAENLKTCLDSVAGWASQICIIDSGSTDSTVEIAGRYTDCVLFHPFESWGVQMNWALASSRLENEWVLRLDADEFVLPELRDELCAKLPQLPQEVTALYCKRRVYFMGRWIRHGGYYPFWLLRVFRRGKILFEQHYGEAEHALILEGRADYLQHDFVDYNRKNLAFWTLKHEDYADREVKSLLRLHDSERIEAKASLLGSPEMKRRWLKKNVYARSPLFLRAFVYFFYRYFIRLGFLDGIEGLIFHVLQGFWYRFYVDAKTWEAQHLTSQTREK